MELAETRSQVLAAREAEDADTERALAAVWQLRLQQYLHANPSQAGELERLLEQHLTPALPIDEASRIGSLTLKAKASGSGRVYQAGRDLHNTER
ncbi:hypothetical protein [Streptomyces sp. NPDC054863]